MALKNIGYKTLCLYVGLVLGFIYMLVDIFKNWLTTTDIIGTAIRTMQGFAFLTIIIPLIAYIAHIFFIVFFKVETVLKGEEEE